MKSFGWMIAVLTILAIMIHGEELLILARKAPIVAGLIFVCLASVLLVCGVTIRRDG